MIWTVHISVTDLGAAKAFAAIEASFFSGGAGGERGTGSDIDAVEALSTFTRASSRIRQAQV